MERFIPKSKWGATVSFRALLAYRAPTDSKDSFALIPAVRVAGDPRGTQGLPRVQQMVLVRTPRCALARSAIGLFCPKVTLDSFATPSATSDHPAQTVGPSGGIDNGFRGGASGLGPWETRCQPWRTLRTRPTRSKRSAYGPGADIAL
jgi:hypothetical protein